MTLEQGADLLEKTQQVIDALGTVNVSLTQAVGWLQWCFTALCVLVFFAAVRTVKGRH